MVRLQVAKLLRQRRMSVYRLAKLLRLPPTTVYRLVRGPVRRVDVHVLDRLCAVLDCSVADLFERTGERPRQPRRAR